MRDLGLQQTLAVETKLKFSGSCRIQGDLYDLGEYPGLIPGDGQVDGELYELLDERALTILDDYEDYHPDRPANSLFIRSNVRLLAPEINCWVYFYNRTVIGRRRITGMTWVEFLLKQASGK